MKINYLPYDRDDKITGQLNFDNLNNEEINLKKADLEIDNLPKKIFSENSKSEMSLSYPEVSEHSEEGDSGGRNVFLKTNESMENLDKIFFDNFFHGVNEWTICDEPASSKIDRSATTMIKTVKAPVSSTKKLETTNSDINRNDTMSSKRKHTEIGGAKNLNLKKLVRPNTTNIKISAVDQNLMNTYNVIELFFFYFSFIFFLREKKSKILN